jgi:hypothetical protein
MKRIARRKKKGSIDRSESFDAFLAKEGLLAETEDAAAKEIIADQPVARMERSAMREKKVRQAAPDFASLYSGYACYAYYSRVRKGPNHNAHRCVELQHGVPQEIRSLISTQTRYCGDI